MSEPSTNHLYALASVPVGVACFGFLFLLFFDRDKLQSEDYQIRKKSLEIIEQSDGSKLVGTDDLHLVQNPASHIEISSDE